MTGPASHSCCVAKPGWELPFVPAHGGIFSSSRPHWRLARQSVAWRCLRSPSFQWAGQAGILFVVFRVTSLCLQLDSCHRDPHPPAVPEILRLFVCLGNFYSVCVWPRTTVVIVIPAAGILFPFIYFIVSYCILVYRLHHLLNPSLLNCSQICWGVFCRCYSSPPLAVCRSRFRHC